MPACQAAARSTTTHRPSSHHARNRRHQLPQQHGHDGAGRWHAAFLVELTTRDGSALPWSWSSSPSAGSAPRPRSGRCRRRDLVVGAGPGAFLVPGHLHSLYSI
jgi:hypothetical protein